jgi:thioredoxin 1
MAANLAVSSTEFKEKVLDSSVPVLVDFWAEWCGPCKALTPTIEQIATEYASKASVYKVDVDQNAELASEYNVMSIPALLLFKGGKVVDQIVGNVPKPSITAMIDRAI